jgi:hypothetical protein
MWYVFPRNESQVTEDCLEPHQGRILSLSLLPIETEEHNERRETRNGSKEGERGDCQAGKDT